jgi:hypothetical protein
MNTTDLMSQSVNHVSFTGQELPIDLLELSEKDLEQINASSAGGACGRCGGGTVTMKGGTTTITIKNGTFTATNKGGTTTIKPCTCPIIKKFDMLDTTSLKLDTVDTGLLKGGEFDEFTYTGDSNDIIAGIATAENGFGISNTRTYTIDIGTSNDIIIGTGNYYGIINYGIINIGNGNDSIITNGRLNVGNDRSGSVFSGNGRDYIEVFGNNSFNGGNDQDTPKLTPGSYITDISETAVEFSQPSSDPYGNGMVIMKTSEFEKFIAGNTTYDSSSLTNGQTIFVA